LKHNSDEKLCGPRFLECAGANRRRIGVHSDIVREGTEVCAKVNTEWMSSTQWLQARDDGSIWVITSLWLHKFYN